MRTNVYEQLGNDDEDAALASLASSDTGSRGSQDGSVTDSRASLSSRSLGGFDYINDQNEEPGQANIEFGPSFVLPTQTAHYDIIPENDRNALEKSKTLTYFNGLSLVVGLIIGSGIFASPSQVNAHAGSPGAALIAWAVAGFLAWTGAACYGELGGLIPFNGGPQVYLGYIYGECMAFVFAWATVLMLKPGSIAIGSIIFSEYVLRAIAGPDATKQSIWLDKAVALGVLALVTLINLVSTKMTTRTAGFLMVFKFLALVGVAVTGVIVAVTGLSYGDEDKNSHWKDLDWFEGTTTDPTEWALTLYAGLWAYDGWDNINYAAGEFINPARDIPLVIHTAVPVVIVFFLLANVSYYLVLDPSVIESSNAVAVAFGSAVYGPVGAAVFALAVSGSCIGSLNASTFSFGRLIYAAGTEGFLPAAFSKLGFPGAGSENGYRPAPVQMAAAGPSSALQRAWDCLLDKFSDDSGAAGGGRFFQTPVNALLLNAAVSSVYIVIGKFGPLLSFYGVVMYAFHFLVVLGIIILRIKGSSGAGPGLGASGGDAAAGAGPTRPSSAYRTWLTTPAVFCCVCLFLLSRSAFSKPVETMAVFAVVAAGVPVYWFQVVRPRNRKLARRQQEATATQESMMMMMAVRPGSRGEGAGREGGRVYGTSPGRQALSAHPSWQFWRRWL